MSRHGTNVAIPRSAVCDEGSQHLYKLSPPGFFNHEPSFLVIFLSFAMLLRLIFSKGTPYAIQKILRR